MLFCIYNLLLQNEARKMNHQEVVEEDRRKKLPQNWEQKRKRVEWDEEQEKKRKVCLITKNI
jgi:pre-mRNA-splicing factor SYF2